ncbi:UbiX family flavin prenyltransferase [Catenovulum sp. 2E275]|uniref:flavin prenyltransferase UbiX n=1 Tax=Catenovulum sp. 2E275 TaxID=2980497 RepID=UPI0021D06B1B|nr:flavin prenyltransferase UbiX [Catenovulum sp. 2E275]MCU4674957.1 UbiX family flavin prenyltransferase [Catenovulum sp. 2E275]
MSQTITEFNGEISLALTGASGMPYAVNLLKALVEANYKIHLLISSAALVVLKTESNLNVPAKPESAAKFFTQLTNAKAEQIQCYGKDEWFSPVASGSSAPKKMVICPASMGTVSAIVTGASDNLIERAADVIIKEKGQLIILPREMPFSAIHLDNLAKLAHLGVTVMPASPGFYHQPQNIDDLVNFVVARILDHLNIKQTLMSPWGYQ